LFQDPDCEKGQESYNSCPICNGNQQDQSAKLSFGTVYEINQKSAKTNATGKKMNTASP